MRVIGVIDLKGGRAVHARGGRRDSYAPVGTAAGMSVEGDAVALARAYVEGLGVRELYVADLDAIERGVSALHADIVRALAALGVPLWVDAGTFTVADVVAVLDAGARTAIVGLETLATFDVLDAICLEAGRERIAFSLDLRLGLPVTAPNVAMRDWSVGQLTRRAADAGVGSVIVLDLARVGTGAGIDLHLMEDVRRAAPRVTLLAGGGVRDSSDLRALAAAGCDGALAATALLSGAIAGSGNAAV